MTAYYCLHKFHKFPSEFLNLPIREKAFIIAAIEEYIRVEKKAGNSSTRR